MSNEFRSCCESCEEIGHDGARKAYHLCRCMPSIGPILLRVVDPVARVDFPLLGNCRCDTCRFWMARAYRGRLISKTEADLWGPLTAEGA